MMKKILLCISVLLTVFFVTFSAGCIGGSSDPIVGSWEDSQGMKTMVLNSGGSGQITWSNGPSFPLDWHRVSGSTDSYKITMTMYSGYGGSQTDTVKLSGDTLYYASGKVWAVRA